LYSGLTAPKKLVTGLENRISCRPRNIRPGGLETGTGFGGFYQKNKVKLEGWEEVELLKPTNTNSVEDVSKSPKGLSLLEGGPCQGQ